LKKELEAMILDEEKQKYIIEEKMNTINVEEMKVLERMKYTRNDHNIKTESQLSFQSPNKNTQNNSNTKKYNARSIYSSGSGSKK
jgi:hypothetical protein